MGSKSSKRNKEPHITAPLQVNSKCGTTLSCELCIREAKSQIEQELKQTRTAKDAEAKRDKQFRRGPEGNSLSNASQSHTDGYICHECQKYSPGTKRTRGTCSHSPCRHQACTLECFDVRITATRHIHLDGVVCWTCKAYHVVQVLPTNFLCVNCHTREYRCARRIRTV
jgi:hypothetical protein